MQQRLARAAAALAVTVVVLGGTAVSAQQTAGVDVRDNEFVEPDIAVTAGDTVEWTQSGSNPHSVTADDGSFDSHPNCLPACMGQGDTFSHTFETPGEYRYYCKIHGGPDGQGMSGIVRVQAATQEEPTTTTTEPPVTSTTEPATTPTSSPPPPETGDEEPAAPPTAESSGRLPSTGMPGELAVFGALVAMLGVVLLRLGLRMR